MRPAWQTVPVFLSSTFNDMHAERDFLVKRVFPGLQAWCEARRLFLVPVDLRWGVTELDATRHRNVVKVCLAGIDRCRPFFLCLLGQRYGWVPRRSDIADDTFAPGNYPALESVAREEHLSVTALEIKHAFWPFHSGPRAASRSASYYERAEQSFFYAREGDYLASLPPELRRIYTDDQEEGCASLRRMAQETARPMRRYQASWRTDPGHTTPELAMPLACPSSLPENQQRWRQAWREQAGIDIAGLAIPQGSEEERKARACNDRLTAGRLADFRCAPGEGPGDLDAVIFRDLTSAIEARFPDHVATPATDDLQKELDEHEAFEFHHARGFLERRGAFDELDAYARSPAGRLFVLTGEPGMGKSALLACWARHYREGEGARTGASVQVRFLGASDRSGSVIDVLRFLLRELKERHGRFTGEVPDDPQDLRRAFVAGLQAAGERGPTVLVLDGLNQLDTGLRDLGWLPRPLPPGVRVVVSFARGTPEAEDLLRQLRSDAHVFCADVRPFEAEQDRRRLVDAQLGQYLKQLDDDLVDALVAPAGSGQPDPGRNPLFLTVAAAELRVFGSFPNLRQRIEQEFGTTPVTAFAALLARLERDPAYSALEPGVAVGLLYGLLGHARRGLTRDELATLLVDHAGEGSRRAQERPLTREEALDVVHLYLRQAQPFLARREGRDDFFYESFKEAARLRYAAEATRHHRWLAQHFRRAADPARDGTWAGTNPRAFSELPYHLHQFALASADPQPLYDLADDEHFRRAQWRALGHVEPLLEVLRFAAERACATRDAARCARHVLGLLDLRAALARGALHRLGEVAGRNPERACELANLLPAPADRFVALVLVAWVCADQPAQRGRARQILTDLAGRRRVWIEAGVAEAFLAMARDMALRQGLGEVGQILGSVPECPPRRACRDAWVAGPPALQELAAVLARPAEVVVPAAEWKRVADIRLLVQDLRRQHLTPEVFEKRLHEHGGLPDVPRGWGQMAALMLAANERPLARIILGRLLFLAGPQPARPVRTFLALRAALVAAGEADEANEYAARVRNAVGWLKTSGALDDGQAAALLAELDGGPGQGSARPTGDVFGSLAEACAAGAEPPALDALLAEVVRAGARDPETREAVHRELTRADRHTGVAQGLGVYYLDAPWLLTLWAGLLLLGLGAGGASAAGVVVAGALAAGGVLDLLVWGPLGIWEKPERIRRALGLRAHAGSLLALAVLLSRLSSLPRAVPNTAALLLLAVVNGGWFALHRRGQLLIPYPRRVKLGGTALATLAGLGAAAVSLLAAPRAPANLLAGAFLAGAALVGVGLNLAIKNVFVRRYYQKRGVAFVEDQGAPYQEDPS